MVEPRISLKFPCGTPFNGPQSQYYEEAKKHKKCKPGSKCAAPKSK